MISGMFLVSKAKETISSRQQFHLLLNKKKYTLLAKLYWDNCTICTVRLELLQQEVYHMVHVASPYLQVFS